MNNERKEFNPQAFEQHMQVMSDREKILEKEGVKVFRVSTTERAEFKECRRR